VLANFEQRPARTAERDFHYDFTDHSVGSDYSPKEKTDDFRQGLFMKMATLVGLEPMTSAVTGR